MTKSDFEEETYSLIFASLKHPIRRRILRMLHQKPSAYSNILNELNIESGHLNYHLDQLGSLIVKNNSAYGLSTFGRVAFNLLKGVEEPLSRTEGGRVSLQKKVFALLIILISASLISGGFGLYYYQENGQLRSQLDHYDDEVERLEADLAELSRTTVPLESAFSTYVRALPELRHYYWISLTLQITYEDDQGVHTVYELINGTIHLLKVYYHEYRTKLVIPIYHYTFKHTPQSSVELSGLPESYEGYAETLCNEGMYQCSRIYLEHYSYPSFRKEFERKLPLGSYYPSEFTPGLWIYDSPLETMEIGTSLKIQKFTPWGGDFLFEGSYDVDTGRHYFSVVNIGNDVLGTIAGEITREDEERWSISIDWQGENKGKALPMRPLLTEYDYLNYHVARERYYTDWYVTVLRFVATSYAPGEIGNFRPLGPVMITTTLKGTIEKI